MLVISLSISASVGFGLFFSSAATAMIIPLWQYPHCGTSCSSQAFCTLFSVPFWASPSIVVICLPSAALTGTEHERMATPSMCTVQAPHWAMPQPYLVPVRPIVSRNTHSSGVLGSTSTVARSSAAITANHSGVRWSIGESFIVWKELVPFIIAHPATGFAVEPTLRHLEKFFSPSRCESDSLTAMGHGRMERASHGADGLFSMLSRLEAISAKGDRWK